MKRFTAILLSIFTLFALTACQPTPEAAVVMQKDTDRMVEQATGDGESAALPLREQLAAPDMMNVTAEEDGFTILAHASVILPETDAIPVITVKAGSFSQELTNILWDLLIGDKAMYKPRTEDDRTKAELEQAIINIQNDIERIQHNEYYEENKALREAELEHLRKLYGAAPDIYEPAAATVFGVYFKLQSFVYIPVFGMNNGIVPIIAYNYGAGKPKRITDTLKLGVICSVAIMTVGLLLFQLIPAQLLGMFAPTDDMIRLGETALRIFSVSFVFAGVSIVLSSGFQALGNGFYSMIVFIVRLIVPTLPFAWLFGIIGGVDCIWWSLPVSDLLGLIVAILLMRRIYKNVISKMYDKQDESSAQVQQA